MQEALGSGLLTASVPKGQPLISYRHVLAALAIHEAIPVLQRRKIDLRAGHALEQMSPPSPDALVRHFREADDTARWCQYTEQAANLSLVSGDHGGAAALLLGLVTQALLPAGDIVRIARKFHLPLCPDTHRFVPSRTACDPSSTEMPLAGPSGPKQAST